jgi:hypothetical protein
MTDTREAREEAYVYPPQVEGEPLADADNFPRMIFRKGTAVKIADGLECDFMIVGNQAALDNKLAHGWYMTPTEAAEAEESEDVTEPYNPRPNEPDNAPFQNTPYVDSQSGEAVPASPPDIPIAEPASPEEEVATERETTVEPGGEEIDAVEQAAAGQEGEDVAQGDDSDEPEPASKSRRRKR